MDPFDDEPPDFQEWVEAYKRHLTPEDIKWYETVQQEDLVPLQQVIAELADWMRREGKDGGGSV